MPGERPLSPDCGYYGVRNRYLSGSACLFQAQMIMQRNRNADRKCDRRRHQPVIYASSNIVLFQCMNAILGELHPAWLTISCEHVHLYFKSSQFFEHFLPERAYALPSFNRSLPDTIVNLFIHEHQVASSTYELSRFQLWLSFQ